MAYCVKCDRMSEFLICDECDFLNKNGCTKEDYNNCIFKRLTEKTFDEIQQTQKDVEQSYFQSVVISKQKCLYCIKRPKRNCSICAHAKICINKGCGETAFATELGDMTCITCTINGKGMLISGRSKQMYQFYVK